MKTLFVALVAAAALLLIPSVAAAQSPGLVPVQGSLADASGAPISDTLPVIFTIYGDSAGGAALWSGTQDITFEDGAFVAYLGSTSGNEVDLSLFRDYAGVWLGIDVNGSGEMPLFEIATAPFAGYASFCGDSDSIGGQTANDLSLSIRQSLINSGDAHDRYTDAEALAAVGAHYTDADAIAAVGAHYTDTDVFAALGAHGDSNDYYHDRYTDAEAIAAVGPHFTNSDAVTAVTNAGVGTITSGLITTDFTSQFSATGLAIPDNNPNGVVSTISVPSISGTVNAFTVSLDLTNSDLATLTVTLADPIGNAYVLWDGPNGSGMGTDIDTSYPSPTVTVSGDLTTWLGQNPVGDWTLTVVDSGFLSNDDDGEITSWGITVAGLSATAAAINGELSVTGGANVTGSASINGDATVGGTLQFDGGGATISPRKMAVSRGGGGTAARYSYVDPTGTAHTLNVTDTSVATGNSHIYYNPTGGSGGEAILIFNIEGSSIGCTLLHNEDDAPGQSQDLYWATDGGNTAINNTAWGNNNTSSFMIQRAGTTSGHVLSTYTSYFILCM